MMQYSSEDECNETQAPGLEMYISSIQASMASLTLMTATVTCVGLGSTAICYVFMCGNNMNLCDVVIYIYICGTCVTTLHRYVCIYNQSCSHPKPVPVNELIEPCSKNCYPVYHHIRDWLGM